MAGGIVEVNIDWAKPGKTLVPGGHHHPCQPASVVASVSKSEPQVVDDVESIAASKLPPPHEGVHLAELPVVVAIVKNISSTATRPGVQSGAQLDRKFSSGAEKAEEAAAVHPRAGDGAGEGGDARDCEGKGGGEEEHEEEEGEPEEVFSQHVSLSHQLTAVPVNCTSLGTEVTVEQQSADWQPNRF